jgi:putative flippase GtrA
MKTIVKIIRKKHIREIILYGIIGILALIVQMGCYTFLCQLKLMPSIASIIGSIAGMVFGYFGHTRYTFQRTHKFSHHEFIKYIITGIICLAINTLSVYIITDLLKYSSHAGLLPMFITPFISFLISKFWAFK